MQTPSPHTLIAEDLGRTGLSISPLFLSGAFLTNTQNDLDTLQQAGKFETATVGKGSRNQVRGGIRHNQLCWIDRLDPTLAQTHLWQELDLLKQAFNRTLFLGLSDFEGHYTSYPNGGFYSRHLDSFSTDNARMISIVLYLNKTWLPADGGELRIFSQDENQVESHVDIAPVGGTLACFFSRESQHEVLLSHAEDRLSFTGWFKIPKLAVK